MVKLLFVSAMVILVASANRLTSHKGSDNSTMFSPCNGHLSWYQLGPRCARFFTQEMDYISAELHCRAEKTGAFLVSIHSSEENADVDNFAKTFGKHNPRIWIGSFTLGHTTQGNRYLWTDGTPMNFAAWLPDEPSSDGQCMEMNWLNKGRWNDVGCYRNNSFVCAFPNQR